ncbi:hypothetical protein BDW22DRAFT_1476959 [Trametopsis cervina]|nr:hypothetical protein BDW22DRAFT_1476959 [Trametopsis cervina]
MPSTNDDAIPNGMYPYFWHSKSGVTLQDFLKKYKPSMVQNDGTKPWLWVEKTADRRGNANKEKALEEAAALLNEVTKKVESIQNDDSIPVRANKKKGLKSKKELREQARPFNLMHISYVQTEASEKLKDISVRHGYVIGKWLIFAPPDKVDLIWSALATSLIEGPLAQTDSIIAKVSTSPQSEVPNYQHVMCLYMPDVYDKDKVTEVMKLLLRNHGMTLMGVKADLYTGIGLDSKHPSGVQSTIWKNTALMKDTEMKALKEEYYKAAKAEKAAQVKETALKAVDTKPKPKLKKKAVRTDIFASDNEEGNAAAKETSDGEARKPQAKKPVPKRKNVQEFESDEEDKTEAESRKRKAVVTKAGGKPLAKKRARADSDGSEDARPRKAPIQGGQS